MTRQETVQATVVMLAWTAGLRIQHRLRGDLDDASWHDHVCLHACSWDFFNFEYRVHPADHPRILP